MTCRELIAFLDGYLDGELSREERRRFEAHLAACPDCVNYVASYRLTVALGRAACAGDALPADVPEDLVQAILAAH